MLQQHQNIIAMLRIERQIDTQHTENGGETKQSNFQFGRTQQNILVLIDIQGDDL